MTAFEVILLVIFVLTATPTVVYLLRLRKRDITLFRFCQARRELMAALRESGAGMSNSDYQASRELLDLLNAKIMEHS